MGRKSKAQVELDSIKGFVDFHNEAHPEATVKKISKLINEKTVVNLERQDIRLVVQFYYQVQKYRLALAGQLRSAPETEESEEGMGTLSHDLLNWVHDSLQKIEQEIKKAIDAYTDSVPVGKWLKQTMGIGPILAGGLLANFDIEKAPSVSHFYSYAGLNDNNVKWLGKEEARKAVKRCVPDEVTDEALYALAADTNRTYAKLLKMAFDEKGKRNKEVLIKNLSKPPYNIELKTLCWKVGESFVKVSGNDKSLYGRLYKERRMYEDAKNEAGDYAEQAYKLAETVGKTTEAYKYYSIGKLPPSHIISRAKRYAVKIFISHLYDEMYKEKFNKQPVRAYVFEYLGHVDKIEPEVPSPFKV